MSRCIGVYFIDFYLQFLCCITNSLYTNTTFGEQSSVRPPDAPAQITMTAESGESDHVGGRGRGLSILCIEVPCNVSIASFERRPRNLFDYVM